VYGRGKRILAAPRIVNQEVGADMVGAMGVALPRILRGFDGPSSRSQPVDDRQQLAGLVYQARYGHTDDTKDRQRNHGGEHRK